MACSIILYFLYFVLELLFNQCYSTNRKAVHDMKKESTATRLKLIMKERKLRQVDILEKCKPFCLKFDVKLGRNDLSQYVNGKVEPGQEKLTILGMALNVSEAWLMGFDVPKERTSMHSKNDFPKIASYFNKLNILGKETATEQVRLLTLDEKYTKPDNIISIVKEPESDYLAPNAAHSNDGATQEEIQHDEDIMDNDEEWN